MEKMVTNSSSILSVRDLSVEYYSFGKYTKALRSINFDLYENEVLGILGESGSGKSTVGFALLNMIEEPHKISGSVTYHLGTDVDLLKASQGRLNRYRWSKVAMIFQASMNSFDPLATVGNNFAQLLLEKKVVKTKDEAKRRVITLFRQFNLPDITFNLFPFELSGGMKQRVSIAMAISCNPSVLIADEPTTALDTVTQFNVLQIIKDIVSSHQVKSAIFITHDVSVEFLMADRIMIMLGGRIVEYGTKDEMRRNVKHPYTKYLLEGMISGGKSKVMQKTNSLNFKFDPDVSCPFVRQCEKATQICSSKFPEPESITDTHVIYCYNYDR
jgi:oligopeptide/dipeptide ABC transporter ATP-binding protein